MSRMMRTREMLAAGALVAACLALGVVREDLPEPTVPSFDAPAPVPPPAGLRHKDGIYGFSGRRYASTFGDGVVEFAPPAKGDLSTRPQLRLRLEEARCGDAVLAEGGPAAASAGDDRISYVRGDLVEQYVMLPESLEQIFIIDALPARRGELVVRVGVGGAVGPPAGTRGNELTYTAGGRPAFRISDAVAFDAAGRRLALELEATRFGYVLTLPASWVASAVLPITIDPLVGSLITVEPSAGAPAERGTDVAYNLMNDEWLVVWSEPFGASAFDFDIYAQRVAANGTLVGPTPIVVDVSAAGTPNLSVAWSPMFNDYLVVWGHDANDDGSDIDLDVMGRRISAAGTLMGSQINVSAPDVAFWTAYPEGIPDVAWASTAWMVAIERHDLAQAEYDILLRRVQPTSDTASTVTDSFFADSPAISLNRPSIAYNQGEGQVLVVSEIVSGTNAGNLAASVYNESGQVSQPATWINAGDGSNNRRPDVSAAGEGWYIVWERPSGPNDRDIRGRAWTGQGAATTGISVIAGGPSDQTRPRVMFSQASGEHFVVYADPITGDGDIYGRRVAIDGTLVPGGPYQISTSAVAESHVASPPIQNSANEVLLAWNRGAQAELDTSAVFNPATGQWAPGPLLTEARRDHTATKLADGRVLVAGGRAGASILATCELYDPAAGQWSATGSLTEPRVGHTATLLSNGTVLVTGGEATPDPLASAEIYDPVTGAWTGAGFMFETRSHHAAALLSNGQVLLSGGFGFGGAVLSTCEIYDPATFSFSPTSNLAVGRADHTATTMSNGKVLAAGGTNGGALGDAEQFNPITSLWEPAGFLNVPRSGHRAVPLAGGDVLAIGGSGGAAAIADGERFNPASGTWTPTGTMGAGRADFTATLLQSGLVLAAGGSGLSSAELYDPATGVWSATGPLPTGIQKHTATLLNDGTVLVAGGFIYGPFEIVAQRFLLEFALPPPEADATPPDAIDDLAVTASTASSVSLEWTAPGDDGAVGTATTYDVRYSTTGPIADEIAFSDAEQAAGEPAPSPAGTVQSMTVNGLADGTQHWFAIKAVDNMGNTGGLSNSPSGTTAVAGGYETPFDDDAGWTFFNNDPANGWAVDATPPTVLGNPPYHSPSTSLNYNNGVNYEAGPVVQSGSALSLQVDISTMVSPVLQFWCNYEMETADGQFDERFVTVYDAFGFSVLLDELTTSPGSAVYGGCAAMGQWHVHTVALDPSWGSVQVEFLFTADTNLSEFAGWFVDDFTIKEDTVPPAAVSNLTVTATGPGSATLQWTAPGDDGTAGTAAQYDVRYSSTGPVNSEAAFAAATPATGEPTPASAGTTQSMTVSGLSASTQYWFAIKTADEVPNWSTLSNSATGTTEASADTVPPAAITDMFVAGTDPTSAALQWTAPGDDGSTGTAAQYDVRYSATGPITTDAEFDAATPATGEPAPAAAGTGQGVLVTGLTPSTQYWFAIKTGDEVPNWSAVSNSPTGTTADPDVTPPAAVADLTVTGVTNSTATLEWTAPGDDGTTGIAAQYDLRYSTVGPIVTDADFSAATAATGEPAPAPPGTLQTMTVGGLTASTPYWFAIKTADETPNWSAVSNSPTGTTTGGPPTSYQTAFDDANGWVMTPPQNGVAWAVDNTSPAAPGGPANSPMTSLNYNNGVTYDSGLDNFGSATSPQVNITNVSGPVLSFWCNFETEPPEAGGGVQADARWVRISNNGFASMLVDVQLGQPSGNGFLGNCAAMGTWHQHTASLNPAWGTIQVRFFFDTFDFLANNFAGWYVDDLVIGDVTPPSAVTDLAVTGSTSTSVSLQWTAQGDDAATGTATAYDVRYAASQILTDADFAAATPATGEPVPGPSGAIEAFVVGGLTPSTTYWFALKVADEIPNWSALSNSPTGTTTAGADTTPPAAVTNLATGAVTPTSVALSWTAPGDDGASGTAAQYELRYATAQILSDADFNAAAPVTGVPAPQAAGSAEAFTVTGLVPATPYWFAIKTADEVPNWSAQSNSPTATTAPPPDTTPPAAVTNLATGAVTPTSVALSWTAPGDDGTSGTAAQYDLRYATSPIATDADFASATQVTGEPAPQSAGQSEAFTVTGLAPATQYWFAIRTADEVPNWSALSNSPTATTAPPPDTTPPAAVADLSTGGVTDTTVFLFWTAPGDDGTVGTASQYDLRYATSPIASDADFALATPAAGVPAPQPAGSVEGFTITGLSPSTQYWFAIKTADEVPNWSALSNSPTTTTAPPPDTTPPTAVTDLATGTVTSTSVELTWTAPGDDGSTGTATTYDVRYSTAGPIASDADFDLATEATGEPAPSAAGAAEAFTVGGLSPSTPYWFAIKTADEVPNWSALSNSPTATTSAGPDMIPPAAVTDLATGFVTDTTVDLSWTAPGDDGAGGTASQYDLRYATSPISTDADFASAAPVAGVPGPQPAGSPEAFTVTGLAPSTPYWFAIKTADEVPNWSALSNSPTATTDAPADTTPPAAVTDLATGGVTDTSVFLSWTAPGDDGTTGTAAQYDLRYSTSQILTDADFASATPVAGVPAPQSAGSVEAFTVTGLAPSTQYWFAIKTADEVPNWSALSNSPTATTTAPSDTIPPAAVTNLSVTGTTPTSVGLQWTAPGDDGTTGTAAQYDIRYATSQILSEADFATATPVTGEPAPLAAGTTQSMSVGGLSPTTTYWFAMKTADEVPNWSALSNSPSGTTTSSDTTPPTVVNVTSSAADGSYGAGALIPVTVQFSEPVNVTGTPQLTLQTAVVDYASGSGTDTLTFDYTVAAGEAAADLDYASTTALAGTIQDAAGNNGDLTLPAPGAAGSLGANKNIQIDTIPPAAVTNLTTGALSDTTVDLSWTAPGDDGAIGTAAQYDLRYATSQILTDADFAAATPVAGEPVPSAAGSPQAFTVTGLAPSTTYWFAIKTADEIPNWSTLSNSSTATTAAPPDTTPPAAVTDLATGAVTDTSVDLTWTAPGDDGATGTAAQYDIRYAATQILTDADFAAATPAAGEPAPQPAGTPQGFTVTGLAPSTQYWFAIKTADEVPNWGALSNSPTATTNAAPDTTPPAAVTDLVPTGVTDTSVVLEWTAPGDDGATGAATLYDVRYAMTQILSDADFAAATPAIGEPAPQPAGSAESFAVTGLSPSTTYWFAIKTGDEVPNWSALSSSPTATTAASPPPTVGSPAQRRSDNSPIPTGAATPETSVRLEGVVSDPGGSTVQLQVELKPTSTAFSGTPTATSGFASSGSTVQLTVPVGADGPYHWRARAVNSIGDASPWSSFGGNPDGQTDFIRDTVPPTSTVSTSGLFNAATWPGFVQGTADDGPGGSGVTLVEVSIQRQSDGLFWDGASWGSQAWMAASGTNNWNLPFTPEDTETYFVDARASDSAGWTQSVAATDSFTYDAADPDSQVSTSGDLNSATYPGAIEGTATDVTSGVAQVEVEVRWVNGNAYWNGSAWTATPVWNPAVGTASWSYSFAPSNQQTYEVRSRATDAAGNIEATPDLAVFTYNLSGPDSAVLTVGAFNDASWPGAIAGTAATSGGATVTQVEIQVRRVSDGLYFDGTGWGPPVWLTVAGTTSWSYAFTPVDETYTVDSRATDDYGNVESSLGFGSFVFDTVNPTSEITTQGTFKEEEFIGLIQGKAADAASGVAFVELRIARASDGAFWDGASWGSVPAWLTAVGTINWNLSILAESGELYFVESRATDLAGNTQDPVAAASFDIQAAFPTPEPVPFVDGSSSDGGTCSWFAARPIGASPWAALAVLLIAAFAATRRFR